MPDDIPYLRRLCKGVREDRLKRVLTEFFVRFEGDLGKFFWRNLRLYTEFCRALNRSIDASNSANYRWNKENGYATAMPMQCEGSTEKASERIANQNQNHIHKELKEPLVQKKALNEGWEIFWKAYPKKQGKEKAHKKWIALKPDAALLSEMLIAIELQKQTEQWNKDDGQFIPMPITWLNQKRWQDEIKGGSENVKSRHDRIFGVRDQHCAMARNVHGEKVDGQSGEVVDGEAH